MSPFEILRKHTSHTALQKTVSTTIPTSRMTIPAVRPEYEDDATAMSILSNEGVGVTVIVTVDL